MVFEGLKETSTNFDLDIIEPFLECISGHISLGFGKEDIKQTIEMITSLEVKGGGELEFKPVFQGQEMRLVISVYMDDYDSPDVFFFSSPALIELIEGVMDAKDF